MELAPVAVSLGLTCGTGPNGQRWTLASVAVSSGPTRGTGASGRVLRANRTELLTRTCRLCLPFTKREPAGVTCWCAALQPTGSSLCLPDHLSLGLLGRSVSLMKGLSAWSVSLMKGLSAWSVSLLKGLSAY